MRLSKNLTLKEVVKSDTASRRGIDNTPSQQHIQNLQLIADNVFQPLRDAYNDSIRVSSGFRSKALNKAIGGAKSSQHSKGQALDLDCKDNKFIFNYIREFLDFDQLIWEYGNDDEPDWVHVSYVSQSSNRNQVLKVSKKRGYEKY